MIAGMVGDNCGYENEVAANFDDRGTVRDFRG
jgi:hypothetical protein